MRLAEKLGWKGLKEKNIKKQNEYNLRYLLAKVRTT
jgi:hypothetical protein